jgi:predicted permease
MFYIIKLAVSAIIVFVISEISKRNGWGAALFASLPILSIMAMAWVYIETGSSEKVAKLSNGVFWMVLPSLVFFILVPYLIRMKIGVMLAMLISAIFTVVAYLIMIFILKRLGIVI